MENILSKRIPSGILLKKKKLLIHSSKIIIAAGLLTFIILSVDISTIYNKFLYADYNLILLSFSLGFVNLYFQYLKWKLVCNDYLNIYDDNKILSSLFLGFSTGIFSPGRIGEYLGRGLVLKENSLIKITAATFMDKFFPLMIVLFAGGISSIIYLNIFNDFSILTGILSFMFLTFLILFFIIKVINGKVFEFLPSGIKKNKYAEKIILNINRLKGLKLPFILKMSVVSFLFYCCYLIQFSLLIASFSGNMKFMQYIWGGNLIMFTKTIIPQFTLGELGIREGASIFFLTKLGETSATAFNASIFLFLINLVFPALIGLFLIFRKNDD